MADKPGRVKRFFKWFWAKSKLTARGQWIYLAHVAGLIAPGVQVPVYQAHKIEPESVDEWDDGDLNLMIDEGRRQADRQMTDFDRVGGRAQWLFTIGAALIVSGAGRFAVHHYSGFHLTLWVAGLVLLTLGVGGAAALMATRADFVQIDTAKFSAYKTPRKRNLAGSYSRMLSTGENTIATRITVYRQAVVYVIAGGYVTLIAYLVSR
jgi:hypothetical protein